MDRIALARELTAVARDLTAEGLLDPKAKAHLVKAKVAADTLADEITAAAHADDYLQRWAAYLQESITELRQGIDRMIESD